MKDRFDLLVEIEGNARAESVVDENVMALLQQVSGNGEDSLGNHAVGDIRHIPGTGKPVESPGLDQDNALSVFGWNLFHVFNPVCRDQPGSLFSSGVVETEKPRRV